MSERNEYPPGVPCWVETLQLDPTAAIRFYEGLFGWTFVGPGEMPGDPPGKYFVARLRDRDVAGVASQPPQAAASHAIWNTHIATADVQETARKVAEAGGAVVVHPFDAPPAGRMAVLQDPGGAVFCAWEAMARKGAQIVNEPRAWAMSALNTRDVEASKKFYKRVFGWESEALHMGPFEVTLFRLPGYVGGEPQQPVPRDVVAVMAPMLEPNFPADVPAHWGVDFWIENADNAAAKAAELGGKLLGPISEIAGFRRANVADPQGATFSISQLLVRHP